MTYHKLQEGSYEYDFELRTTLNAIDPTKIKLTETVQPENAKRQHMPPHSRHTKFVRF